MTPCQNKPTIPKKFSLVFKILHSVRYPTQRCFDGEMKKHRQPGVSETFWGVLRVQNHRSYPTSTLQKNPSTPNSRPNFPLNTPVSPSPSTHLPPTLPPFFYPLNPSKNPLTHPHIPHIPTLSIPHLSGIIQLTIPTIHSPIPPKFVHQKDHIV